MAASPVGCVELAPLHVNSYVAMRASDDTPAPAWPRVVLVCPRSPSRYTVWQRDLGELGTPYSYTVWLRDLGELGTPYSYTVWQRDLGELGTPYSYTVWQRDRGELGTPYSFVICITVFDPRSALPFRTRGFPRAN